LQEYEHGATRSFEGEGTKMVSVGNVATLSSHNLNVVTDREVILISYKLSWPMTLGSQLREKDLRRRFKARLKRWSPQNIIDSGAIIAAWWRIADIERAKSAITHADHMLDAFRKERLYPR
jgi:hypothetical protein